MFMKTNRSTIAEELGGKATMGEIAKEAGTRWGALDDDDKAPYNAQAAADKVRCLPCRTWVVDLVGLV
jgi:hypothetical protein